ncbi:hypothetical protein SPRG_04504 [Saprolegnia parasitica CBS 223.65]|uniref:Flagellar associated protein n=1 Tax=Saprolegnia parasitica (strain CBS 223.65) TaxID=695850 RepID=A0A067CMZ6_SAPPC|nr:hypothetical protein SPRG_04504 [Saprolegnia parasitica CBS 223.65]KDO30605.1 hypothetical protein SPRG_04504 [Saprolegnia parasitica CBS 223.65]|eukprot:XP_012198816.1 hypothetical protein SPRG_04504 [Saprolegnia parasitica CBS 223.65]
MASTTTKTFALDGFCLRQFDDPSYKGTHIAYDKAAFEAKINELYASDACSLIDGYAPFCKHLFVPNFVGAKLSTALITDANKHLLETDYVARVPTELPVLARWFPSASLEAEAASHLDIILYSRDQIRKETAATGLPLDSVNDDVPWGIISVKAQDVAHELPMNPITVLRNALGKEEGGSGVPLSREKYLEAVAYWKTHAVIQ